MSIKVRRIFFAALALAFVSAALLVKWQFDSDMQQARAQAARSSVLMPTRCGPIEYEEAVSGVPLLAVHGSGGGHDQGMAFAAGLAAQGIRVIAMSRFGYLRTPRSACSTPWASPRQPSSAVRLVPRQCCSWPSITRIGLVRW
ncbi:MAG: hypothetical protein ABIZ64_11645 [Casimicrobium sp.]